MQHRRDAGCTALADALKVNTTATVLQLAQNSVGDAGCALCIMHIIILSEALKVNIAARS
jgi:hypothetical protein